MSTSDGTILGTFQIAGSAAVSDAFNVVLMGDGFTAAEQGSFDTACDAFAQTFLAVAPFDELLGRINIFRINVASAESGADIPNQNVRKRTYFDAAFGAGTMERLLECRQRTALDTAANKVPEYDAAMVVVNSPIYGGSGGGASTFSLHPSASLIAIHEIGHSAFGLADEYAYYRAPGEAGRDRHPPGEPREPNVTLNSNPSTLKWGGAVTTALLPTMTNPNCRFEDDRPSTEPFGTVGLFEGAHYYRCGVYRPEHNCRMRAIDQPFCTVCQATIRARIGSANV